MAKKRGPGRPPLSAAEKARRKAEREALKGKAGKTVTAKRKPGRPAGKRGPGRPAAVIARRGRKPASEGYPLLAAEITERFLKLEKSLIGTACTNELADRLVTAETEIDNLKEQVVKLAEALKTVTEQAGKTETNLKTLCDYINDYFANLKAVTEGTPEPTEEAEPVAVNQ